MLMSSKSASNGLRNLVKNRKLPNQVRNINKQIWLVRTDLEGKTE